MKKRIRLITTLLIAAVLGASCGSSVQKNTSVGAEKKNADVNADEQYKEDNTKVTTTSQSEENMTLPEEKMCMIDKGNYEHAYVGITSGGSDGLSVRIIENICKGCTGTFYIDNADIPVDIGSGEIVVVYFSGAADWTIGEPDENGRVEGHATLPSNEVKALEGNSLEAEICGYELVDGSKSRSDAPNVGAADSMLFKLEVSYNDDRSGTLAVSYEKGPESTWEYPLDEEHIAVRNAVGDKAIITFDRKTLEVLSYRYPESV